MKNHTISKSNIFSLGSWLFYLISCILCLISWFLPLDSFSQITRGAQPGELYISSGWYADNNGHFHIGIFHTTDNGENIYLKYENIETPPPGEMEAGKVLGDATPGALYNYGNNELWVSFDYGESWEYKETYGSSGRFASGCVNGEIYKCCVNVEGSIWRSENYGSGFIEVTQDAKYVLEVGIEEGNLYGRDGHAGIGYNLHFSSNYGENFYTIPIDSSIAFWAPSGQFPQISRGTEPGEIYLVSWWPESSYKIFFSVDTGYTWTEKFESDYINIYYWAVNYTAGRQPGSFYVMRSTLDPTLTHTQLYIDYSNDYGETFTTYFHDLDSTFTSVNLSKIVNIQFSNYPNPFKDKTTINFMLPINFENPVLKIYNINGLLINQYNILGKISQQWDGCDSNGNLVTGGIYFYNIESDKFYSQFNKLLIIR